MSLLSVALRSRLIAFFALVVAAVAAPSAGLRAEDAGEETAPPESEEQASPDRASSVEPAGAGNENSAEAAASAEGDRQGAAAVEDTAAREETDKGSRGEPVSTREAASASAGARKEGTGNASGANDMPAPEDDYYAKRAKEMLKADEAAADSTPHPLAAAYPGHYVVVCEGGCGGKKGAEIVYMAPRQAVVASTETSMTTTDSSLRQASTSLDGEAIVCIAGCYDTPKTYGGRLGAGNLAAGAGAEYGSSWLTTVSGNEEAPPAAPAQAKGAAKSGSGSGDWMARINKDRQQAAGIKAPDSSAKAEKTAAAGLDMLTGKSARNAGGSDAEAVALKDAAAPAGAPQPEAAAKALDIKPVGNEWIGERAAAQGLEHAAAAAQSAASQDPSNDGKSADDVATPDQAAQPEFEVAAAGEAGKPQAEAGSMPAGGETETGDKSSGLPQPPDMKLAAAEAKVREGAAAREDNASLDQVADVAKGANEEHPQLGAKDMADKDLAEASLRTAPARAATPRDQVISVASDDAEMNAAIEKARAGLAEFWSALDKPPSGVKDFALKVAISGNGAVEHFWLTEITRKDGKLSGTINNEPESVSTVKLGQRYEFGEAQISDWLYKRNGKMVGNETMRPLLKRMTADEAAPYWAMYETP
jgi:uncharacterized protein YegJ (DUF2314 family)